MGRAFEGQGRGWNALEFKQLIESRFVYLCGDERSFALVRAVADEAELLTIATAPEYRCQGLARVVLRDVETKAGHRGATRIFLEVAEDNAAARHLYARAGYIEISRRAGYYARDGQDPVDALILERQLSEANSGA